MLALAMAATGLACGGGGGGDGTPSEEARPSDGDDGVPRGAAQAEPPAAADVDPEDVNRPPAGEVQYPAEKPEEIPEED
jgi:hypothetical protein